MKLPLVIAVLLFLVQILWGIEMLNVLYQLKFWSIYMVSILVFLIFASCAKVQLHTI